MASKSKWQCHGPTQFKPVDEQPDYFFVKVGMVKAALAQMVVSLERHGEAYVLFADDRPCCDPVYLAKPVNGFWGYPTIEKLFRNSPINVLDVCIIVAMV